MLGRRSGNDVLPEVFGSLRRKKGTQWKRLRRIGLLPVSFRKRRVSLLEGRCSQGYRIVRICRAAMALAIHQLLS